MDTRSKSLFKKTVNLITVFSFLLWNLASAEPEGGQVVAGSANISQQNSQTVINQNTQSAVINWNSFNTASSESVRFNQPNSSAVALNKITNGQPTSFNGNLSANGQVWIINPNGVLFGSSANINVAGLLATTNNINNADFMSGKYNFDAPTNLSASIINNGNITVADSGIVALVGPMVVNNSVIQANLGKIQLSTGGAFALDLYGDNLINFGSNPVIQKGYIANTGLIKADGGKVYITAHAASGILDNIINISGVVQAQTVNSSHGVIILNGGHAKVKINGKLDASVGGYIETSGSYVDLAGADIAIGQGGTWLLDPTNVNIDAIAAGIIVSQLNGGASVNINTFAAGPDAGDITVNSPINQTSGVNNTLTLQATRDIIINQQISLNPNGLGFNGGKLTAIAGRNIVSNALLTAATQISLLTLVGDIILNAEIHSSAQGSSGQLGISAGGNVYVNANLLLKDPTNLLNPNSSFTGWQLTVNAGNTIYVNTPFIQGGANRPGDYHGNMIIQQDVTFLGDSVANTQSFFDVPLLSGPYNITVMTYPAVNNNNTLFFNGSINVKSLTVNNFNVNFLGSSPSVVQTTGSQFFGNKVTLFHDLTMIAGGSINVIGLGDIQYLNFLPFFFGVFRGGINGPAYNLSMTSGSGIIGSVDVLSLTLGGTGGANLSPNPVATGNPPIPFYTLSGSYVNGSAENFQQAFLNTLIAPGAIGSFCVNGFCRVILPPVPNPSNIPPRQKFLLPNGLISCSASGCNNTDMIIYASSSSNSLVCLANTHSELAGIKSCVKLGKTRR